MKQFMLLLLVGASLSYAATKSYDVIPYRNYIGTQTQGDVGVTQFFRMTLDSVTRVSFWVGDTGKPGENPGKTRDTSHISALKPT